MTKSEKELWRKTQETMLKSDGKLNSLVNMLQDVILTEERCVIILAKAGIFILK